MVGFFDYADKFKIFPCRADKRPYTRNGYKDASNDPAQLAEWERTWPEALIGIPCAPNGIFALDVDDLASWDALAAGHDPLDFGPIQSTPRGGLHLIFNLPEHIRIPNNASKLDRGLDLRSDGYICTGHGYKWHDGHSLDGKITDAPDWLLKKIAALTDKPQRNGAILPDPGGDVLGADYWLKKYLSLASPGNRNENGFLLACQLRDAGLSETEAENVMIRYAAGVPGADYNEREALASLNQAYKAPRRDAIELKPLPDFTFHKAPETGQAKPPEGVIPEQATKSGELVTDGGESLLCEIRQTQEERVEALRERRWICGTYLRLPSRNPANGKFTSARFRCGHCHACRTEKGKFWREQIEQLVINFEDGILLVEGLTEEQANEITTGINKNQYAKFPNVNGVYTVFVERNAAQTPEARDLIFDYGFRLTVPKLEKISLAWWADLANVSDHGEKRASGRLIRIKKIAAGENEHVNGRPFEFAGFLGPNEAQFADAIAWAAAHVRADLSSEVGYQAYVSRFFDYIASRLSSKMIRFTRKTIIRKVDLAILRDSQKNKYIGLKKSIDLNPIDAVRRANGGALPCDLPIAEGQSLCT